MAVEIQMLSGTQPSKRLQFDQEKITVGEAIDDDICLQNYSDVRLTGKQGVFANKETHWQFKNLGSGTWYVGQKAVPSGQTERIKSGNVIRASENGPDLQFSLIARKSLPPEKPREKVFDKDSEKPIVKAAETTFARPPEMIFAKVQEIESEKASEKSFEVIPSISSQELLPLPYLASRQIVPANGPELQYSLISGKPLSYEKTPEKRMEIAPVLATQMPPSSMYQIVSILVGGAVALGLIGLVALFALPSTFWSGPKAVVQEPTKNPENLVKDETTPAVPPPPKAPPVVASKPQLSKEQLAEKFGGAVVWFAFEQGGKKFPIATGWAITPNTIITTADIVKDLQHFKEGGSNIFVALTSRKDIDNAKESTQFSKISKLWVDPRYDDKKTGAELGNKLRFNLGAVTVETAVSQHCELLPSAELPNPLNGATVAVFGYPVTKTNFKPFDKLTAPKMTQAMGKIKSTKAVDGMKDDDLPLLLLDAPEVVGMDGSAVFSPSGKVIGIVFDLKNQPHVILADYIQEILK